MDRKELLLEEALTNGELSPAEEQKLRKAVDDGSIYLSLTTSPGWKRLLEDYINVEIAQEKYLSAKSDELADIRAAQRALINLLRFIKLKIDEGQKAFEKLSARK